jgi:hypothetical protein
MAQPDQDDAWLSPGLQRILFLVWIGIVLLVGGCIFLATRWGLSERASQAAALQTAVTASPAIRATATPQPSPTPVLAATGAPGMPAVVSGTVTPTPQPTPLPVADTSFGYGVEVQALTDPAPALEAAALLGMGWIKQPVRWADIEAQPGVFDWAALDVFFAEAAVRGLRVLVSVSAAPEWARSVTASGLDGPPDDPALLAGFLAQIVQRYRGMLHAVEIWNEMNREQQWYAAGGLSAAGYMALLDPAARAVREADPGVLVISGGLNPTGIDDGVIAIDDFHYMQDMIDAGLLDIVDCVGAHHMGYNLSPDTPYDAITGDPDAHFQAPVENPHHSWSFYSTLRGYNDMIVAAGHNTPLCVTSFGWATAQDMSGALPSGFEFAADNTLAEQAAYITQALLLMRSWGFVRLAIVDNLTAAPAPDSAAALYSILGSAASPRPAYAAVQQMEKRP